MRTVPRPRVLALFVLALTVTGACAARPPSAVVRPVAQAPRPIEAPPVVPPPLDTGRLPDLARPTRYALTLNVDPSRDRFAGAQRIEVTVPRPTRVIVLNARGLTVQRVTATPAGGAAMEGAATSRASVGGRGEPEELVLTFPREIPAGAATLELAYDGAFVTSLRGLYRVQVNGDWYAFTDSEPTDARRAFPCFDEPGFKVPWEISLTVPTGLVAVANMPEASRSDDAATHSTTVRFAPTPPTSSYLVAFAVGPFDVVEGARTPVPIRAITTRGQGGMTRAVLEAAEAHVRILGEYFDRPYPYPKLDLLAVPEFGPGAMENPGLITFREDLMLFDAERASTRTRRAMAEVLAHELAHQWFGDLVTMAWWNDLWLNEGFATWMQSRVVDQWRPASDSRVAALAGRNGAMGTDGLPAARAVRQPVRNSSEALEAFDGITYAKGAAILTMLEHWLGEDVFRAGIREYVHAHEWGTATATDLFAALTHAAEAQHVDVAAVAATFLDQPGVPVVSVETRCQPGAPPALVVTQAPHSVLGAAGSTAEPSASTRTWRIPVCMTYGGSGAASAPRRTCVLLDGAQAVAPVEGGACPAWVFPNESEHGYYRYAITPPVRAVATPARLASLDVRSRAGFVDDAWAMVRAGQLGADEFLRLMDAFRAERSRVVLETILAPVWQLSETLIDDASRPAFQRWLSAFLAPRARELGWDARSGDDDERRLLRRTVLTTLASVAADGPTLAEAERRAEAYLRDPRSVEPDVAALVLPLASRRANATRVDALLAAIGRSPTPQDRSILVGALSAFNDPATLRHALDATLTDAVRLQDVLRVIYAASGERVRRPTVVAWVTEHFDALRERLPSHRVGRLAGLAFGACTRAEIDEMQAFWGHRVGEYEAAERTLREGLEAAEQCVALRERAAPQARSYFVAPARRR